MIRGDRKALANIFGSMKVILNLPGSIHYDPSILWIYKVRGDRIISADLFFYIDDGQPTVGSAKDTWKTTQRACQIIGYLCIQDTCTKRNSPNKEPGEWARTSVDSSKGLVTVFVSMKKWLRTKEIIFGFL